MFENEFLDNYKQGMYTDDLYNELINEINNKNTNKLIKNEKQVELKLRG